ncbi:MAG: alpha/beta fold hydrolase [Desulfovibrio sp.]|jgi:pyochelin biosynthetic protein PchC|nr:alpha/beta fold hydrolase [Desulfovibrio sp.]
MPDTYPMPSLQTPRQAAAVRRASQAPGASDRCAADVERLLLDMAADSFGREPRTMDPKRPVTEQAPDLLGLDAFSKRVREVFGGGHDVERALRCATLGRMAEILAPPVLVVPVVPAGDAPDAGPAAVEGREDREEQDAWTVLRRAESGAAGAVDVLCLPYAGGRPAMFRRVAERLDASFCVASAMYGRADADGPLRPLRGIGDIAAALLVSLPPGGPTVLVGHCYGAYVAHALARAMADQGRPPLCVVVAGATPPDAQELVYGSSQWARDPDGEATLRYLERIYAPLLCELTPREQARYWIEYRLSVRRMEHYAFGHVPLGCPCLVVTGESEEYPFVAEFAASWKGCFPDCRFAAAPGGHMLVQTHPGEFADVVSAFVRPYADAVSAGRRA